MWSFTSNKNKFYIILYIFFNKYKINLTDIYTYQYNKILKKKISSLSTPPTFSAKRKWQEASEIGSLKRWDAKATFSSFRMMDRNTIKHKAPRQINPIHPSTRNCFDLIKNISPVVRPGFTLAILNSRTETIGPNLNYGHV